MWLQTSTRSVPSGTNAKDAHSYLRSTVARSARVERLGIANQPVRALAGGAASLLLWNAVVAAQAHLAAHAGFASSFLALAGLAQNVPAALAMLTLAAGEGSPRTRPRLVAVALGVLVAGSGCLLLALATLARFSVLAQALAALALAGAAAGAAGAVLFAAAAAVSSADLALMVVGAGIATLAPVAFELVAARLLPARAAVLSSSPSPPSPRSRARRPPCAW